MKKVKVTTNANWPFANQTPGRKGVWGNYRFYINDDTEICDYWFVLYGIDRDVSAICPPDCVYYVDGEPESVGSPRKSFLRQFSHYVSCKRTNYSFLEEHHMMLLPWMIGAYHDGTGWGKEHSKDYDELFDMGMIRKEKRLSVICSDKSFTEGHRKRIVFLEKLKDAFGSEIDIFGRGIRNFADKWDAIAPYQYHIALENSVYDDYFTEKLTDCFLSQAYPIYYGCKNIESYFSAESMSCIDLDDMDGAIVKIQDIINGNFYEKRLNEIMASRKRVLTEYNMFALMTKLMDANMGDKAAKSLRIYPGGKYSVRGRYKRFIQWIEGV